MRDLRNGHLEVCGVLLVIGSGLMVATPAAAPPLAMWPVEHASGESPPGSWGLMMIFVLLTYTYCMSRRNLFGGKQLRER